MIYRHAMIYQLSGPFSASDLYHALQPWQDRRLREPGPLERFSRGFVSAVGDLRIAPLLQPMGRCVALRFGGYDRLLPGAVVTEALRKRVAEIEAERGTLPRYKEQRELREQIRDQLLPQAFLRRTLTRAYVDFERRIFVVETTRAAVAEEIASYLRESGSFPVRRPVPEHSPKVMMTHWLRNQELSLHLGEGAELRSIEPGGAVIRLRDADLREDAVRELLDQGLQCTRLELDHANRLTFNLHADLRLSRLRLSDVVVEAFYGEHDGETYDSPEAEELAWLTLSMGEIGKLWDRLTALLGIEAAEVCQ